MHRFLSRVLLAVAALALPLGASAAEKVRFAVTDIVGLEELQREFGKFKDVLARTTGYDIAFYGVSNRTAAVEAMRSKKVDFVLTGPAEYIVFRNRGNAVPVVGFSRPDYFAAIVVLADSGITSVAELKGKKVAFGDVGSTSKHLGPMQLISDNGLDALKDIEPLYINPKVGWESLKRGDVTAIGTTYTIYLKLREAEKTLEPGAFRVIARGRDLPNDVLLAGAHVKPEMIEKIRGAVLANGPELVQAMLVGEENKKYKGMKFLTKVDDRDYNYVRAMYATAGYEDLAKFIGN
jgi:phosphonate transport system substrate-binding protein